jgi:hypothetical protein
VIERLNEDLCQFCLEWFLVKPRDGVEPFVWRNYCPRCESDGRAEMVRRNVEQR